jgi:hypothetical protein
VCLSGSFVGNTVGIATAAHELAHQLGAVDLYGPRAAWNRNATLMAGTCGAADSPTIFHLDPWHKMAFGWIRPRLLSTADPASAFTIWQPLGGDLPGDAPVLLFDPARGSNEYYLAETRLRDGRNIFDANVADDGVALWHVATTDDHVPRDIFFQDDDDPELDHRLTVALAHAPDGGVNRRFPDFWSSVNGRFTLSWPDGTATGSSLLVAARPAHQRYTEVELGNDMLPRVDEPLAAAWASPGGEFTMRGVFGVMGSRVVALEQDGRFIDLPVVSWSNERVVTRVPAGTLLGSYRLAVYAGPTHAARGNRVTVFVSDPGSEEVR